MDINNQKVTHKVFGEGIVVSTDGNHVLIDFGDKGTKTFIYPDAFETFVKLQDASAQAAVEEEIASAQAAKKAAADAAAAERAAVDERRRAEQAPAAGKKRGTDVDHGFGPDYHVEHLARQPILTYKQVEDEFGIRISGFGKGINKTDTTVVLISSVDKKKSGFVYHDHWDTNGDYIYSGEGKSGDQKMTGGNKVIKDAAADGKTIHLFVKLSPEEYYYQGAFTLVEYYYETEKDEAGDTRKEYKFRLRKVTE